MDKKLELEKMCKESWEMLCRVEEAFGIDSPEANMFRAKWSAFNDAFTLVYEETLHY